jgi:hypothetical protein
MTGNPNAIFYVTDTSGRLFIDPETRKAVVAAQQMEPSDDATE